MYAQSHAVHLTQEYDQEEGLSLYTKNKLMHCYAQRYEIIITTPINLNKFTEFDMKK